MAQPQRRLAGALGQPLAQVPIEGEALSQSGPASQRSFVLSAYLA